MTDFDRLDAVIINIGKNDDERIAALQQMFDEMNLGTATIQDVYEYPKCGLRDFILTKDDRRRV